MSVKVSGRNALRLDEAGKYDFIHKLQHARLLTPHDVEILMKEVGARHIQVYGVDLMRNYIPAIFLLIMWQAIQEAASEEA